MGKLYEYMDESLKRMKFEADLLKNQLESSPDGNLLVRNRRQRDGSLIKKYCYNYYDGRNIRKQRIIRDDEFAKALVTKRLVKHVLPLYVNNINALEECLLKYKDPNFYAMQEDIPNAYEAMEKVLAPLSKYESDTIRSFKFDNELWNELEEYKNEFSSNKIYTGDVSNVNKENVFRSKSEYIIASLLKEYNISYKYEAALSLDGHVIYPDFALRRPNDGRVMFWEHFGLVNDHNYREKMYQKLSEYSFCGITLWDNLIATFDMPEGGINTSLIRKIINVFVL